MKFILLILSFLLTLAPRLHAAAQWQTVVVHTGTVSYNAVTNALHLTGDATLYLNAAGMLSSPGGGGGNVTASGSASIGDVFTADSTNGTSGVWSAPIWIDLTAVPDDEGGLVYTASSINPILNGIVVFGANYLTNFLGDFGVFSSVGYLNGDQSILTNNFDVFNYGVQAGQDLQSVNSGWIFNYGDSAGNGGQLDLVFDLFNYGNYAGGAQSITNSGKVYNYGNISGANATILKSSYIFNYGDAAGRGSYITNCIDIFNYGESAGYASMLTNSRSIFNYGLAAGNGMAASGDPGLGTGNGFYNYGDNAGQNVYYTNCSDIYNYGSSANLNQTFNGKTHMIAFGSGSVTTNSNDFVFGDNAYNYFFPGASLTSAGPGKFPSIKFGTNILSFTGTSLTWNGVAITVP